RDEVGAARRGKDLRNQDLCRCAARLPRRLSRQLPQGRGRGRLEPDDRLVQEIQSARLIGRRFAAKRGASAPRFCLRATALVHFGICTSALTGSTVKRAGMTLPTTAPATMLLVPSTRSA